MNPLLSEAIGSILRWLLAGAAGWLVQHGIWTQAQSQTYIMAAALAVLSIGWSLWQKYKSRVKFLTALEAPAGSDEAAITRKIANGAGAPLVVLCLAAMLGASTLGCGARHEPPNLSPVAHAAFVADPFTLALSDFQDGVIADHNLGYLPTKETHIVLDALQVAYTAIGASVDARRDPLAPGGAKSIAIATLTDLRTRVSKRFAPYIDSALIVMGGK